MQPFKKERVVERRGEASLRPVLKGGPGNYGAYAEVGRKEEEARCL